MSSPSPDLWLSGYEVQDWVLGASGGAIPFGDGMFGSGPFGGLDESGIDYEVYRQQNEAANAELERRAAQGVDITDPTVGGDIVPSGEVGTYWIDWRLTKGLP